MSISMPTKSKKAPFAYTAAVTRGMCANCREVFDRFAQDDDDADIGRPCEACEKRIIEAVLGAGTPKELIQRLVELGLVVEIGNGIEFPEGASMRLNNAMLRDPRILRPIIAMIALHGTAALLRDIWEAWRVNDALWRRIQSYTAEQASKLLIMPVSAYLLRNCRGDDDGSLA